MSKRRPPLPPKPAGKRKGGNPPEEYRFKPGQSGNPGGRPKKKPTMRDALDSALDREVVIPLGDKQARVTVREAIAHQKVASLGSADLPDFVSFFVWLDGPAPVDAPEAANDLADEDDQQAYEEAIRRGRRRLGLSEEDDDAAPDDTDDGDDEEGCNE